MYSLPTELRYWRQVEAETGCTLFMRPGLYYPSMTPGVDGKYSLVLWLSSPMYEYREPWRVATVNIGQQPEQVTGDNIGELLQCVVPWLEKHTELIPLSSPLALKLRLEGATGPYGSGIDHGAL